MRTNVACHVLPQRTCFFKLVCVCVFLPTYLLTHSSAHSSTTHQRRYVKQDSGNLEIPKIYTTLPSILEAKDLVSQNPVVCSSVVLSRNAIRNLFFSTSTYAEDYGLWKEVMKHTNCAVVQQVHVHLSSGNNGDSASERAVRDYSSYTHIQLHPLTQTHTYDRYNDLH